LQELYFKKEVVHLITVDQL